MCVATRVALVCAAAVTSTGCPFELCPPENCASSTSLVFTLTVPAAKVARGTLEVCWNDHCAAGYIPRFGPAGDSQPSLFGALVATAMLETDGYKVEVAVTIRTYPLRSARDTYGAVIRSDGGAVITARRWLATYHEVYPNGRECDETPCFEPLLTEL